MAVWIDPIFDRTQEDVDFAVEKIAEWIVGNITGNPLVVYDLKGCLNVSDINRIEGNIAYLASELSRLHYPPDTSTKSWTAAGMPNEQDISRIVYNVRALITAYYQQDIAPNVPENLLGYNEVNAVEKNLSLIKELLDCMVGSFRKSGTFQSGRTTFLPIRR